MPLIVSRRHGIIEIEFLHAQEGVYNLEEAASESSVSGDLLLVLHNPAAISESDGEMTSNYLIGGNAISESDVSGDLFVTHELGETVSETFLYANTYLYTSQISYSETDGQLTPIWLLTAQAESESGVQGELVQALEPGNAISESDTLFANLLAFDLGETISETSVTYTWLHALLRGRTESISGIYGDLLSTHQPGVAISESTTITPSYYLTFDLGEAASESDDSFAYVFFLTGETVSETHGSWMRLFSLGSADSETVVSADFAGVGIHDLIVLDDTINTEILVVASIARIVELHTYLIRK